MKLSYTLGDHRLEHVRIACEKCQRFGQYRHDRLIAQYGADMCMPDLRHVLANCERRTKMSDPCQVVFVDPVECQRHPRNE